MIKDDFAHTNTLRCHLHILVALDVLKTFLETHLYFRDNPRLFIASTGAHVGKLLGLGHIDDKVVLVDVLADYLATIDLFTRVDEETSTILQLVPRRWSRRGLRRGGR